MLSIPDGLHADPARPTVERDGVWVVDYVATNPTLSLPVVVTRPTFVLIHEGTKELASAERTLLAGAGSLVAMRTGTHVMSDLMPGVERYVSTIVSADRDVLGELLAGEAKSGDGPRAAVVGVDELTLALAAGLRHRVEQAASKTEQQLAVKQVLVSLLMNETIRTVVGSDVCGWSSSHAGRIRSVMSSHCYSPLRLDQYASMCAMSVSTFKRVFDETYDSPPGKWLVETRLQRAAELLQDTERSVTDVSHDSGFGDLSHFTRSFTKRFAVSPTKYRHAASSRGEHS